MNYFKAFEDCGELLRAYIGVLFLTYIFIFHWMKTICILNYCVRFP